MNLLPCEAKSLVYDIGSSSIQFGFAGDAQPLYSVPSAGCQRQKDGDTYIEFGDSWLQKKYHGIEVKRMVDDNGALIDKNLLSSFFDWTYTMCLNIDSVDHPLLVTQPSHLTARPELFSQWRQDICEAAFDFAGHPSLCFEHDSVLACFSRALHTATVVDFGWSCIRVVPILEGQPLLKSMQTLKTGGCQLCSIMHKYLTNNNKMIRTHLENYDPSSNTSFTPTSSQQNYCTQWVLQDIIQSCVSFNQTQQQGQQPTAADLEKNSYYLPNREQINVQKEAQIISQLLIGGQAMAGHTKHIQDFIAISINNNNTPADVRRQLWANIVTSGGLSQLPGFHTELENQTNKLRPTNYTAKVITPMHKLTGGQNTVWAGGSILASLDNFTEYSITKQEYEENGMNILNMKCL